MAITHVYPIYEVDWDKSDGMATYLHTVKYKTWTQIFWFWCYHRKGEQAGQKWYQKRRLHKMYGKVEVE